MTQAQGYLLIGIGFEVLSLMETGLLALLWGILAIVSFLAAVVWCRK